MLVHAADRGTELGKLRQDQVLTDVILVSDDTEIHAHKLLLSLHSFYFRTLFQSTGFSESESDRVHISSVPSDVLHGLIDYIYTGNLFLKTGSDQVDTALLYLQAETLLQLNDLKLRKKLETILISDLNENESLENLLRHWNHSVLFDLETLMTNLEKILDLKLELFMQNRENRNLFSMLGFEEMDRILSRRSICVRSELSLLNLILGWAESNISDPEDYIFLARLLNLTYIDRRTVLNKVTKMFPDFKSTLCSNQESSLRSCDRFYYLVEYKLSKSQLRNIEDFVDKGEKSGFYSIGLPSGSCNKVQEITSASSLCGTCNGNYFRPVTQGTSYLLRGGKMFFFGGKVDSDSRSRQSRKDVLSYDTVNKVWMPPIKKLLSSSKKYKKLNLEQMDFSEECCYALFKGETEKSEIVYYIDEVSLDGLNPGTKPSTSFLSNLPSWFKDGFSLCYDQGSNIYVCGGQGFARFNLETQSWEKLQKPIGDLGEEKPWLAGVQSSIFLLSGKPKSGDSSLTNHLQMFDVDLLSWRLTCNLNLRFTPSFLGLHNNNLIIAGWCPARKNFLLTVKQDSGEISLLISGIDGVFSPGLILHQDQVPHLVL